MQNHYETTSKRKFWNQNVQFWYLHHLALSNSLGPVWAHVGQGVLSFKGGKLLVVGGSRWAAVVGQRLATAAPVGMAMATTPPQGPGIGLWGRPLGTSQGLCVEV